MTDNPLALQRDNAAAAEIEAWANLHAKHMLDEHGHLLSQVSTPTAVPQENIRANLLFLIDFEPNQRASLEVSFTINRFEYLTVFQLLKFTGVILAATAVRCGFVGEYVNRKKQNYPDGVLKFANDAYCVVQGNKLSNHPMSIIFCLFCDSGWIFLLSNTLCQATILLIFLKFQRHVVLVYAHCLVACTFGAVTLASMFGNTPHALGSVMTSALASSMGADPRSPRYIQVIAFVLILINTLCGVLPMQDNVARTFAAFYAFSSHKVVVWWNHDSMRVRRHVTICACLSGCALVGLIAAAKRQFEPTERLQFLDCIWCAPTQ